MSNRMDEVREQLRESDRQLGDLADRIAAYRAEHFTVLNGQLQMISGETTNREEIENGWRALGQELDGIRQERNIILSEWCELVPQ